MNQPAQLLLLLLLLLSISTSANAQLDLSNYDSEGFGGGGAANEDNDVPPEFKISDFEDFKHQIYTSRRKLISVASSPRSSLRLSCSTHGDVTLAGWVKGDEILSSQAQLTVQLSSKSSFGVYRCIAGSYGAETYPAVEFVVTEKPNDNEKVTEIPAQQYSNTTLRCKINTTDGNYQWFKYDDAAYRFVEMPAFTSRSMLLHHSALLSNYEAGYTFYKCQPGNSTDANSSQTFRLNKQPSAETVNGKLTSVYRVTMRPIKVDVAAVPIQVTPKSTVLFKCQNAPGRSGRAVWYFRKNSTTGPSDYRIFNQSVAINYVNGSSILSVHEFGDRNLGYYRCSIDGVEKYYAVLSLKVIVPKIRKFSRGVYNMSAVSGSVSQIKCEIQLGGDLQDVVWRVVPPSGNGPEFDIRISQGVGGFLTSVTKNSDTGNPLVMISFADNAAVHAYRLECRLGEKFDFVTLKYSDQPKPVIMQEKSPYAPVLMFVCNPSGLRSPQFHFHSTGRLDSFPRNSSSPHHLKDSDARYVHYRTPFTSQEWARCSGLSSSGQRVYSKLMPVFPHPPSMQLRVDGAVLNPNKPHGKVASRPTEITCQLSISKFIHRMPVELRRNDAIVSIEPETSDNATFKYILRNPSSEDAGTYQCRHPSPLIWLNADSSKVTLNWCNPDQFTRQGTCQDPIAGDRKVYEYFGNIA